MSTQEMSPAEQAGDDDLETCPLNPTLVHDEGAECWWCTVGDGPPDPEGSPIFDEMFVGFCEARGASHE